MEDYWQSLQSDNKDYRLYVGSRNSGRRVGLARDERMLIKRYLGNSETTAIEELLVDNTSLIKAVEGIDISIVYLN